MQKISQKNSTQKKEKSEQENSEGIFKKFFSQFYKDFSKSWIVKGIWGIVLLLIGSYLVQTKDWWSVILFIILLFLVFIIVFIINFFRHYSSPRHKVSKIIFLLLFIFIGCADLGLLLKGLYNKWILFGNIKQEQVSTKRDTVWMIKNIPIKLSPRTLPNKIKIDTGTQSVPLETQSNPLDPFDIRRYNPSNIFSSQYRPNSSSILDDTTSFILRPVKNSILSEQRIEDIDTNSSFIKLLKNPHDIDYLLGYPSDLKINFDTINH
jgi:hypothetical protein